MRERAAGPARYDALVSFSYNVGSRAFCQSTLVRKLNAEDYAGACAELLRWRFFQGKRLRAAHQHAAVRRAGYPARSRIPAVHIGEAS